MAEDKRTLDEIMAAARGVRRPSPPVDDAPPPREVEGAPPPVDDAPAGPWKCLKVWTPPDGEPPPTDWLLWMGAAPEPGRPRPRDTAPMMRRGKVGLLSARGGTGKSAALCGLALAVRTGRPWLQEPMRAGDQGAPGFGVDARARGGLVALLMGEEDLPELDRRLCKAAELMGLSAAELRAAAAGLVVAPLAGVEAALVEGAPGAYALGARAEALCAELEAHAKALGGVWSAVLLDPLSRFGGAACETDNAAATLAITALERLTQLPGNPAVLVAHHERKGGGDGADAVRGASALVDGARWVGRLTVVQAPDKERRGEVGPYRPVVDGAAASMVRLEVAKTNYTGPMEPRLLTVADGGIRAARKAERDELAAVLAEAAAEKKAPPTKKDTKKARPTDPGV